MLKRLGYFILFFGRTILIDPMLLSQGTYLRYDPLEHGSTLMLDGQVRTFIFIFI